MSEQTIPVVNLSHFHGGSSEQQQQFVQTLGDALMDLGFFAVTNHGVDSTLIERCYKHAELFFSKSEETKKRYEFEELNGQRGFTSFGKEHAKDSPAPDLKEFWHVGRELTPDHALAKVYGHNIWPKQEDVSLDFQPDFLELYKQLETCAMTLLQACGIYLGESTELLSDMAIDGDTILRIIHYPPIADDAEPASIRAGAHEDINLITLLCEATNGGLELLQRDGTWRAIHSLKGQIVVDAGDMIQNLTNGVLKSTTHRVVNPNNARERRFSMPFFVHPRAEVSLQPLESCVRKMGPNSEFKSISARDFLMQRLKEIGLTV
ncbi:MAG: isopenicillin N synthase family oxygenase [Deltaproteobacteria bacterium]|jgi:isopenicillin N synthase-like dioxygenase|nr:isopenicillin N synthase family oxygenase [Deltaproteobacteria bacterium]MBT6489724.1 isopenicillin N synthase family oxygenase [Deltaproteobacteria bacterium]